MNGQYTYNAFISYRHSPLDMYVAKAVHRGLETFKVPSAVKKATGRDRIRRVFRDQEELPIGSDLNDNISKALESSEFLIVICSPRTPGSEWVRKEITSFISMHGRDNVLAILVEGEPDDSFPPEILKDEEGRPVEPLAADVRGETQRDVKKKLKSEIVRLCAPLLHCTYDDLKQRHKERRMRKILTLSLAGAGVVAALSIAFAIYSSHNARLLAQSYEVAQSNYEKALANQSLFLADISEKQLEEGDRRVAALVALEALPDLDKEARPYVPEARYALTEALNTYHVGKDYEPDSALKADLLIEQFQFSDDSRYIVAFDQDYSIYLWNVEDGKLIFKKKGEDSYGGYYWIEGVWMQNGKVYVVSGGEITILSSEGDILDSVWLPSYCREAKLSADGKRILIISDDVQYEYELASGALTELPQEDEASLEAYESEIEGLQENGDIVLERENVTASLSFLASRILLSKRHVGSGAVLVDTLPESIYSIAVSPGEEVWSANCFMSYPQVSFFYEAKSGEMLGKLEYSEEIYVTAEGFADDTWYYYTGEDDNLVFHNVYTGDQERVKIPNHLLNAQSLVNKQSRMLVLYEEYDYVVVDLTQRRVAKEGSFPVRTEYIVMGKDGKGYLYSNVSGLLAFDMNQDRATEIGPYYEMPDSIWKGMLSCSADASMAALLCADNVVRIYDAGSDSTIAEIQLSTHQDASLQFDASCENLYIQGSEGILRRYDIRSKLLTVIESSKTTLAADVIEDSIYDPIVNEAESVASAKAQASTEDSLGSENRDILVTILDDGVRIYEMQSMTLVARAPGGLNYLTKSKEILAANEGNLYRIPYVGLSELIEDEHCQYGDDQLTEDEKRQFHLD